MPSSDDLKTHATSNHDFYALLSISPTAGDTEIRRAYRKTALKYHPDKISNSSDAPALLEKFHVLQIAYDVLSDPAVRQLYDNARQARERKRREGEVMEGKRRRMKEDLEMRERGVKRVFEMGPGEEDAEEKLAREIRRIAEDGRRRVRERDERLRREMEVLEEEERRDKVGPRDEKEESPKKENVVKGVGGTAVPEIDRTVKARWRREEALGNDLDKDRLVTLFSKFGKVENAFMLKDKKQRVGERKEKKIIATGVVVFTSIVGAHAAVEDSKKQKGGEWDVIESVYWAGNKEPDLGQGRHSSPTESVGGADSAPSTPNTSSKPRNHFDFSALNGNGVSTPATGSKADGSGGLKKAPSFASFSSAAAFSTPQGSPAGKEAELGPNSPSLEEITLIRLKNAERKRLEEQIRREDEAAEAAEAK